MTRSLLSLVSGSSYRRFLRVRRGGSLPVWSPWSEGFAPPPSRSPGGAATGLDPRASNSTGTCRDVSDPRPTNGRLSPTVTSLQGARTSVSPSMPISIDSKADRSHLRNFDGAPTIFIILLLRDEVTITIKSRETLVTWFT